MFRQHLRIDVADLTYTDFLKNSHTVVMSGILIIFFIVVIAVAIFVEITSCVHSGS